MWQWEERSEEVGEGWEEEQEEQQQPPWGREQQPQQWEGGCDQDEWQQGESCCAAAPSWQHHHKPQQPHHQQQQPVGVGYGWPIPALGYQSSKLQQADALVAAAQQMLQEALLLVQDVLHPSAAQLDGTNM